MPLRVGQKVQALPRQACVNDLPQGWLPALGVLRTVG